MTGASREKGGGEVLRRLRRRNTSPPFFGAIGQSFRMERSGMRNLVIGLFAADIRFFLSFSIAVISSEARNLLFIH